MMAKIVILILSCDNLSFLINNFIFSVFFSDHFLDKKRLGQNNIQSSWLKD